MAACLAKQATSWRLGQDAYGMHSADKCYKLMSINRINALAMKGFLALSGLWITPRTSLTIKKS